MTARLEIDHVSKSFERGLHTLHVLRNLSLSVRTGDFVAVYGKPRAGKSTLLRIAAGLMTPDGGDVRLDGRDLAELSGNELADVRKRGLAWVERDGPRSPDWRMVDYVALPLMYERDARRRALDALERLGVGDCATATWAELGNRDRLLVALAHATAREPAFLLLDDPTAGLDALERDRVMSLLRAMADETSCGVLMAVPDMPSMLRAHEVLSLSRGRLLGPPEPPDGHGTVVDFPGGAERSA